MIALYLELLSKRSTLRANVLDASNANHHFLYNPRMRIHPSKRFRFVCLFSLILALLIGCGSGTHTSPPAQTFLFQPASSYKWVQQFGAANLPVLGQSSSAATEVITGMASDSSGNAIAAGYVLGEFAGASNPGQVAENFIAKYDMTGAQIWVHQFGTGSGDFLRGVAVDSANNIYSAGVTLGALPGASNPNKTVEGTVYKLTPDGSILWQQQFTIANLYTYPSSIAVSSDGSVFLGGTYSSQSSPNSSLLFITKLDGSSGAMAWQSTFGTDALDSFSSIGCDPNGDVYATVNTTGPFPGQLSGQVYSSLIKLSGAGGTEEWTEVLSEPNFSTILPLGLAIGSKGIIVGGGVSNQQVTLGSTADSSEAAFLASFSPTDGSTQWNKVISTTYGDEITGVATSPTGSIYAVGETNGIFASGFVQPTDDMMLLKLGSDGTNLTAAQFGTGAIVNQAPGIGPQITASGLGPIYVGGPVQTPFSGFSNPTNELQMFISRFDP